MALRLALLIGFLAMLPAVAVVGHGFVYDDSWTVVGNHFLDRPLFELAGLFVSGEALAKRVPDATRPVMAFSLVFDRLLFGTSAAGHHLSSLLLYGLNCFLATAIALRLSRRLVVGLVAGAFFALAPLHAEPVAAINYREDLLSGAGVLGAWLCLLGRGAVSGSARHDRRRAIGAAALFGLALFAKESAVALVPLLALTAWFEPGTRAAWRRREVGIAFGVVVLLWMAWRLSLALRGDDIPLAPARSALETAFRSARFLTKAVGYALFPFGWGPDHFRQPAASPFWLGALVGLVGSMVVLFRRRRTRVLALGLAIALLAPLPSSPLFRPINELADRYFFLGILGGGLFWGVAVAELGALLRVRGKRRALLAIVCLPMLIPFGDAVGAWRDERTLWQAAVERNPNSPRAWAALSRVHRADADHGAAARTIDRALRLDPEYPPALVTRVYNEIAAGRLPEARRHLRDLDQRGLGDYRGVARARRCAELDAGEAPKCLGPVR